MNPDLREKISASVVTVELWNSLAKKKKPLELVSGFLEPQPVTHLLFYLIKLLRKC